MRRTESHFRGSQQIDLFYQTWWAEKARGTLVVTHGFAEHSDCYNTFATRFGSPDWNIFAWDLRGHGRSEGKRGLVRSFDEYCLDLVSFVRYLNDLKEVQNKPIVLLGHSMGGLVVLKTIMDHDLPIVAVALSSPLLGIKMKVPPIKDFASRFMAQYLPNVTLHNTMIYEHLSRDPEMIEGYRKDPLRHEKISPNLYLGMLESMAYIIQNPHKIKRPILMQLSGHDLIVDAEVSKSFFDKIPFADKTFHTYKDSYHEIFNDLDHKDVIRDLNAFLNRFLGTA